MPREWDAETYDRVAAPMTVRGTELVDGLRLRGDETVLDAGCGTGQVTERLLARLPEGRVIALDGSQRMLDLARERLGDERVTYVRADLHAPLPLPARVDAVISTSTFHWVRDHAALFRHLAAVLKPGGVLSAECGGAGNIAGVLRHVEAHGVREHPWTFATPEETVARLEAAGFTGARAHLYARDARMTREELPDYLRTVVLGSHIEALGPEAGERLVEAVAAGLEEPVVDYVRLVFTATAAPGRPPPA